MPIQVLDELPAINFLDNENVFVMTTTRASTQEIRPQFNAKKNRNRKSISAFIVQLTTVISKCFASIDMNQRIPLPNI
ncbi:MAG: hypothetical protein IGNPGNKH_00369 [Sodalis sp. Ffu]|nr:MAG: hypothetical protein IGNPGNKH_00369 [Sodalis sp. Ffu]